MDVIAKLVEFGFYATLVAMIVALAAAIARRWRLARNLSRAAILGVFAVVLLVLFAFAVLRLGSPSLVSRLVPGDPSDEGGRARLLAEAISAIMNCGVSSLVLLLVPSVSLKILSDRRLRSFVASAHPPP